MNEYGIPDEIYQKQIKLNKRFGTLSAPKPQSLMEGVDWTSEAVEWQTDISGTVLCPYCDHRNKVRVTLDFDGPDEPEDNKVLGAIQSWCNDTTITCSACKEKFVLIVKE